MLRFLPCIVVLACARPLARPTPENAPSAKELLHRLDAAYAAAVTYVDRGDSVEVMHLSCCERTTRRTFTTIFRRSGGFLFRSLKDGNPRRAYVVWSSDNKAATTHSYFDGALRHGAMESALGGVMGASQGVAGDLLNLLLYNRPPRWKDVRDPHVVADVVRGVPCWKLTGTERDGGTIVLWIDRSSSLVRQIQTHHHFSVEEITRFAETSGEKIEPFDTDNTYTFEPARDVALASDQITDIATDGTVLSPEVWLGVALGQGRRIARVYGASPATAAGLQVGDEIERIDEHPIASMADLDKAIEDREVGSRVAIHVLRAGTALDAVATLDAKSDVNRLEKLLVGKPAPEFKVSTIDGKLVSLAALRGKFVVLDFWATWCGPCRYTTPMLAKLAARYPYVEFVGLSAEDAATQDSEHAFTHAIDVDNKVAEAYFVSGLPTFVVIGADGVVRYVGLGIGGAMALDMEIYRL